MAYIYRITNRFEEEMMAIRQLIRASNAENIARRCEQDKAAHRENMRSIGAASIATIIPAGA